MRIKYDASDLQVFEDRIATLERDLAEAREQRDRAIIDRDAAEARARQYLTDDNEALDAAEAKLTAVARWIAKWGGGGVPGGMWAELRARLAALEPLCRATVDYDQNDHADACLAAASAWARSDHGREFAKGMKRDG